MGQMPLQDAVGCFLFLSILAFVGSIVVLFVGEWQIEKLYLFIGSLASTLFFYYGNKKIN